MLLLLKHISGDAEEHYESDNDEAQYMKHHSPLFQISIL